MREVNETLGVSEVDDLEELEDEVSQMGERVLQCRENLPDQLKKKMASILALQRPVLVSNLIDQGSEPGPSQDANSGKETTKRVELLKERITSNISAMPVVMERLNMCISRIDKLDSFNGITHPAFKQRRTS
ncbi:hypothetical protein RJ641_016034 [Dillenia turbinata]|uniref:Uncharacterized protein n=1 Tax=Dillenia turbinata TaxID=194707 RepID=A0AAN8Z1T7_9MAGN